MEGLERRSAKGSPAPSLVSECSVDPLLVGADRDFLNGFPKKLIQETRCLPIRRFRGVGLVVAPSGSVAAKTVSKLQRVCEVRLIVVPALHAYGIDLFLRYWESGDHHASPPLWIPDARRPFVNRLGDALAVSGRIQWAPIIASLLLTAPLASLSPVLVVQVGKEGQAIFLHGTAGLKLGVRFPPRWLRAVLARLSSEFDMKEEADRLLEGKGKPQKGLDDLTGLLLPPLKSRSFVIEPRIRR